jgi:hypothetical protein
VITLKNEHSIRNNFPRPEDMRSPLDLLIAKEEPVSGWIIIDAEVAIFLADFSSRFPLKWLTVKEKIRDDRSTHEELAMRLRTSPRTIARHLNDLRSEARKWNGSPMVGYRSKA